MRYSRAELALRRELKEKLQATDSEIARGQFRERLQRIREGALERARQNAERKAERQAETDCPKRESFATNREFEDALELFRLKLSEMACKRVLDNPTFGLRARIQAEKKLKEISARRLKLTAGNSGPQAPAIDCGTFGPSDISLPDVTRFSDEKLRNDFAKEKWFRANLDTNNDELIAALEQEIRRRKIPLYWSVDDGTNKNVDEAGKPVLNLAGYVYIGTTPHDPNRECTHGD